MQKHLSIQTNQPDMTFTAPKTTGNLWREATNAVRSVTHTYLQRLSDLRPAAPRAITCKLHAEQSQLQPHRRPQLTSHQNQQHYRLLPGRLTALHPFFPANGPQREETWQQSFLWKLIQKKYKEKKSHKAEEIMVPPPSCLQPHHIETSFCSAKLAEL